MNYRIFAVLLVWLFSITGCASLSTLHTATPVDKGENEINLAPGYYGASTDNGSASIPNVEVAGRYGLSENMDFGAKVFPIGAAFDLNYAFHNSENFSVSVNPYASIIRYSAGDTSFSYGFVFSNVLFDILKSDGAILTLGLKPGLTYATASADNAGDSGPAVTASGTEFLIGGMAGVKLKVSDNFKVMPSVDMATAPAGNGAVMYQASLGFMF